MLPRQLYKAVVTGRYYSDAQIKNFVETFERVMQKKHALGRTKDIIPKKEFQKLLTYATHEDPQVREQAQRGIKEALSIVGRAVVIYSVFNLIGNALQLYKERIFYNIITANVQRNVSLISKLSQVAKRSLVKDIILLVSKDFKLSEKKLKGLLTSVYELDESEAGIIALDQTRKFEGAYSEAQQIASGITDYIWTTMLDDRVRDTHRVKHGKRFSWLRAGQSWH